MQYRGSANSSPHTDPTYRHRSADARVARHLPTLVDAHTNPDRAYPGTDAGRNSARPYADTNAKRPYGYTDTYAR